MQIPNLANQCINYANPNTQPYETSPGYPQVNNQLPPNAQPYPGYPPVNNQFPPNAQPYSGQATPPMYQAQNPAYPSQNNGAIPPYDPHHGLPLPPQTNNRPPVPQYCYFKHQHK